MFDSAAIQDGLGVTIQPYRFNGKESQKFAGLPYLDYGARYYHPLSSRWTTMDPMAEKYYSSARMHSVREILLTLWIGMECQFGYWTNSQGIT